MSPQNYLFLHTLVQGVVSLMWLVIDLCWRFDTVSFPPSVLVVVSY